MLFTSYQSRAFIMFCHFRSNLTLVFSYNILQIFIKNGLKTKILAKYLIFFFVQRIYPSPVLSVLRGTWFESRESRNQSIQSGVQSLPGWCESMQISGLGRNGRLGDINAVKYGRYSEEIQVNIQIFLFYKKADMLNKSVVPIENRIYREELKESLGMNFFSPFQPERDFKVYKSCKCSQII